MRGVKHPTTTNLYGKPKNWDETGPVPVGVLPVTETHLEGTMVCTSYWELDEAEIATILAGGHVKVEILGGQPPIRLGVVG